MPSKKVRVEVCVVLFCLVLAGLLAYQGYAQTSQSDEKLAPEVSLNGQQAVEVPADLQAPGVPPVYAVRKVTQPPVIDGKLDDEAWKDIPRLEKFYMVSNGGPMERDTAVRFVSDAEYLYLFADCDYPDADKAAWEHPDRDWVIRTSETVKLYLAP